MKKIAITILVLILPFLVYQTVAKALTIAYPIDGGTGTYITPTEGQVLVGQADGTYLPVATSTLGVGGTPAGSSGQIQFNNNGVFGATSTFVISTSTGNVGVGTTSPTAKLSVTGSGLTTGKAFEITDSANTPKFTVLDNGNVNMGQTVLNGTAQKLTITNNADDTAPTGLTFANSGNGGNTGSRIQFPYGYFESRYNGMTIANAGASSDSLTIANNTFAYTGNVFTFSSGLSNDVTFFNEAGSGYDTIFKGPGEYRFKIYDNGAGDYLERLTILQNGNVGIGTTSPSAKLSVTGSGLTTGKAFDVTDSSNTSVFSVQDNGQINMAASSTNSIIYWTTPRSSTAYQGLSWFQPGSWGSTLYTDQSSTGGGDLVFADSGGGSFPYTERFRVGRATGNVKVTGTFQTENVQLGLSANNVKRKITGTGYNGGTKTDAIAIQTYNAGGTNDIDRLVFTTGPTGGSGSLPGQADIKVTNSSLLILNSPITGNGNLGIGTTTPAARLSVQGGIGSTSPLFMVASSSNDVYMNIIAGGNVGIGSSTPTEKLDVNGYALFQQSYGGLMEDSTPGTNLTLTTQSQFYAWASASSTSGLEQAGAGYMVATTTGTSTLTVGANGGGKYQVGMGLSIGINAANQIVHCSIFKNGTKLSRASTEFTFTNANEVKSMATPMYPISLVSGDVLDLRCSNDTSAGKVITFNHAQLSAIRFAR